MNQQLLFNSEDQIIQSFQNFYPANNKHVLSAILTFMDRTDEFDCLYVYGQSGSGKTHLLRSAALATSQDAHYIDLANHKENLTDLTESNHLECLILDNYDSSDIEESQLLFIYETLKAQSIRLLVAASKSPRALDLQLADLTSRLLAAQIFELKLLNDEDKIMALRHRASLRGFELSDEVIGYVINRYPRDLKSLFGLLDKLDNESLLSHRKITVPFVKSLETESLES